MKKAKKVIIVLVILLMITTAVAGVLYWQTNVFDFLRSPKAQFFTYMAQNGEALPRFDAEVMERFNGESYNSSSTIEWNIGTNSDAELQEYLDFINEISLRVQEIADRNSGNYEIGLGIQFEGAEFISMELLANVDSLSLRVGQILEQHITIENRDLSDLVEMFGFDGRLVPDRLEIDEFFERPTLTQEQLEEIQERYFRALYDAIDAEKFERTREVIEVNGEELRANAHTLTLTETEILGVAIQLLETAKEDNVLIDFLVDSLGMEITRNDILDDIEDMIFDLENEIDFIENDNRRAEETITITVYEYRGRTVLTRISADDIEIILERTQISNGTSYTLIILEYGEEIANMNMTATYVSGEYRIKFSTNIEGVSLELELALNSDLTDIMATVKLDVDEFYLELIWRTTTDFRNVHIANPRDNYILNDMTEEELFELLAEIIEGAGRFFEENADILEMLMAPFTAMMPDIGELLDFYEEGSGMPAIDDEAVSAMNNQSVQMFNSRWQGYAVRPQSASQIRALTSSVNAHNASSDRYISMDPITPNSQHQYNVELSRDAEGYINGIIITIAD